MCMCIYAYVCVRARACVYYTAHCALHKLHSLCASGILFTISHLPRAKTGAYTFARGEITAIVPLRAGSRNPALLYTSVIVPRRFQTIPRGTLAGRDYLATAIW